jgi:diketogulonate reductase-like aldo/keto reductase
MVSAPAADGLARQVVARDGLSMPAFGLGTWHMGESAAKRVAEVAALRLGIELGVRLIDTAELYGSGGAEEIVAEATRGKRDALFIVSKVMPQNASRAGTLRAAEASLKRLRTDRIDLYLLHWPGSQPLAETLAAFEELKAAGKIRHYGLSNFDVDAMSSALSTRAGRALCCNQVVYSLARRGIESGLLYWCADNSICVMGYSPLDQGRLRIRSGLKAVAKRHGVTPEAVAIAWSMRLPHLVTIPKATAPEHLHANLAAARIALSAEDLAALDQDYPPPRGEQPLDVL